LDQWVDRNRFDMTKKQCHTPDRQSARDGWGALELPEQAEKLLARISLFEDLDDRALKRIAKRCNWLRFDAERQVVGQSDMATDVFFIARGSVRVNSYSSAGKEVTYLDIGEGQFFGEFSAIDGKSRSASVLTLSEALIGRISAADFNKMLLDHPSITQRMLKHLVGKARQLTDRVFEFSTLAVRNRLHCELLRLTGEAEGAKIAIIEPAPTHYELATRISTHREAITRELKYLTSEGLVELKRGKIKILDIPRLREMVQRTDGYL